MASQESSVDFGAGQASGLEQLAGASPAYVNLLTAADKSIRVRPLVTVWSDFPAAPDGNPIIGMFPWRDYLIYVGQDSATGIRKLWAWLGPGNVVALSDATAATQLEGTGRPVFTYDSQRVVVTGGGAPQQWLGVGLSSRLGGSPPNATHIGYLSTRLVVNANDLTGELFWTPPGVGNHETWNGLDFAEAEAAPDPVVALYMNSGEAFAFGTRTLQTFVPDPEVSFSTTTSALSIGCGAPYGIIDTDDSFAWLDDRRRFVKSTGREFEVLSSPLMTKSLEALETISDCWGARVRIGSFDVLLWVFPTEGRAIYFEQLSQKWGEWRSWDGVDWTPWVGQSYVYWPEKNLHLVGLDDGNIGQLSLEATTELGETVKALCRTGFRDGGTLSRKLCQRLQVTLRRGFTATTEDVVPSAEIRYRDDLGAFSNPLTFSLGAGDYTPTLERWGLGMYRQRQYELSFTGAVEFVLVEAKETTQLAES